MTDYQARETIYCGVRMRSRLEACFAAHLDAEGMEWQYEGRVFASAAGQWLPDFIVDRRVYVECKPDSVSMDVLSETWRRMHGVIQSSPDAILAVYVGSWVGGSDPYRFKRVRVCAPSSGCADCQAAGRRIPSLAPLKFYLAGPRLISHNDNVWGSNRLKIAAADWVFAWIDQEMDCFGTFAEIGYASAIGVPVIAAAAFPDTLWSMGVAVSELVSIEATAPTPDEAFQRALVFIGEKKRAAA